MDRAQIADALIEAASKPWAIQPERLEVVTALTRDLALGKQVDDYRLARVAGANDLSRAASSGPVFVPDGRGGSAAIVSIKGIALYDLEFQPFAFSSRLLAMTMPVHRKPFDFLPSLDGTHRAAEVGRDLTPRI